MPVVGIAAASLEAAEQLARLLHSSSSWDYGSGLELLDSICCSTVHGLEGHALLQLLHSSETRTLYVLAALQLPAAHALQALAQRRQQHSQGQGRTQQDGTVVPTADAKNASATPATPAAPDNAAAIAGERALPGPPGSADAECASAVGTASAAQLPLLAALQAEHGAHVNAALLLLFLSCDVVLLAPGGAGPSSGACSSGGGDLLDTAGWLARLRLLQIAKRLMCNALAPPERDDGGRRAGSRDSGRAASKGSAASATSAGPASGEEVSAAAVAALAGWCSKKPPLLLFVVQGEAAGVAGSEGGVVEPPCGGRLRQLLQRCRPIASPHEPCALACVDAELLVAALRPAALRPDQLARAVLTALQPAAAAAAPGATAHGVGGDRVPGAGGGGDEEDGDEDSSLTLLRQVIEEWMKHGPAAAPPAPVPVSGTSGGGGCSRAAAPAVPRVAGQPHSDHGPVEAPVLRELAGALGSAACCALQAVLRQPISAVPPALAALDEGSSGPRSSARRMGSAGRSVPTPTGAAQPAQQPLAAAASWLVAGCGRVQRLAASLREAQLAAAVQQYEATTPPLVPFRVHRAAVARLAAAYGLGPADAGSHQQQQHAFLRLRSMCDAVWAAGRRQCSALSVTGRPCACAAHGGERPHGNACRWLVATSSGTARVRMRDHFDPHAANTDPDVDDGALVGVAAPAAQTASAGRVRGAGASAGRGRGGAAGGAHAAAGAASPGAAPSTRRQSPAHAAAAAAGAGAAHDAGDGWGYGRYSVVAVAESPAGALMGHECGQWVSVTRLGMASAQPSDRRGITLSQPGLAANHLYPLTLLLDGEEGAEGGLPGPARAARGRGMAPAAVTAGAEGSAGDPSALDEAEFPSLEAATAAQRAQPHHGGSGGGRAAAGGKGGDPAVREREAMRRAWPLPSMLPGGGTVPAGADAAAGDDTATDAGGEGGEQQEVADGAAGAAGTSHARGGAGGRPRRFPNLGRTGNSKRMYIGFEYETLDGRRCIASPQQLGSMHRVATAGASPAGQQGQDAPPGPALSLRSTGGRAPHHGGVVMSTAALQTVPPTAATAAIGSDAACYLLQHDVPLFLELHAWQQAAHGDAGASGLQPPPSQQERQLQQAEDAAPAWDPAPRRPTGLAQLRRIFIATPPSASTLLSSCPLVRFSLEGGGAGSMPQDAAEAALLPPPHDPLGGHASGRVRRSPRSCVRWVEFRLRQPVGLPPDSLLVVTLPLAYACPAHWLGWRVEPRSEHAAPSLPAAAASRPSGTDAVMGLSSDSDDDCPDAERAVTSTQEARGATGSGVRPGGIVPLVPLGVQQPFAAMLVAGSALRPVDG